MKNALIAAAMIALLPFGAMAGSDDDDDDEPKYGMAGLLGGSNKEDLPPVILSSGRPLTDTPWVLQSGTYYEFEIQADGSQELGLVGPGFFRAIWIDEMVIEGIEIRPLGVDSVEFDEAGEMEIGFIAIKPGSYFLKVPGSSGDLQTLQITIK